jgi:predicted SprT family Zn-dependent metalloprotease
MDARETLLHELAHAVVERTLRGAGDWHGRYWQSVFASACKEAYGLTIRVDSAYHGKFKKAAAERDERG